MRYTTYPPSHLCTHAHKCTCVQRHTHPDTLIYIIHTRSRTTPTGNIVCMIGSQNPQSRGNFELVELLAWHIVTYPLDL